MNVVITTEEQIFAHAKLLNELAIHRAFAQGVFTAEIRDKALAILETMTCEEIMADMAAEDRAAAPK